MLVHATVIYGFRLPQEYDELMQFEAETDTSKMRKIEDTIATRYIATVTATYPYKSKKRTERSNDDSRRTYKETE